MIGLALRAAQPQLLDERSSMDLYIWHFTAEDRRSPGVRSGGSRGCTGFLAGLMKVPRPRQAAAVPTRLRLEAERIIGGTHAFLSAWKAITCARASSMNRRTASSSEAESFSTSSKRVRKAEAPCRRRRPFRRAGFARTKKRR